jgi:NADPH2:quinone reductase
MSTNVMKALRFAEFGPPSVLRIEEVAIPGAGRGGSTCSREGCSDQSQRHRERRGTLQEHNSAANPRPGLCGRRCKGEAAEGEEVWGSFPKLGIVRDGAHAEYVVVPAETLSPKPKSLSMAQAAPIGVPYITAWASLV